jgi:hypothetical protein
MNTTGTTTCVTLTHNRGSLTATTFRNRAASAGFAAPSRQLDSPARRAARKARSPFGHPAARACRYGACSLHTASDYGFRPFGPSPPRPTNSARAFLARSSGQRPLPQKNPRPPSGRAIARPRTHPPHPAARSAAIAHLHGPGVRRLRRRSGLSHVERIRAQTRRSQRHLTPLWATGATQCAESKAPINRVRMDQTQQRIRHSREWSAAGRGIRTQ